MIQKVREAVGGACPQGPTFHWKDGLMFARGEANYVHIWRTDGGLYAPQNIAEIPPQEWGSIVEALALPAWQPIATAPKDDAQPVLGWIPSYFQGRGGIAVILWQGGKWWDNGAFETKPTHWMPLPLGPMSRGPAGDRGQVGWLGGEGP